jgi:small subunit ribosomal protein S21
LQTKVKIIFIQTYIKSSMIVVNIKENESLDKALKRFKKKFEKAGVLRELRSRTYFEKPSVRRRSEIIRAAYREKIKLQEEA